MKMAEEKKLYQALNIPQSEYDEILSRLKREPNELETYLFSAMWSEHCGYKHSRKYLRRLPSGGAVCEGENAGGILIGNHVITFKVESHNHPSAVEPFQGAATGIGGIIRDILAIGARPIALLNSLKFGKLKNKLVKHLFHGVVDGISAYGNSIGVPTVAGEVGFDTCYTDSPLVNVMAVGIVHKDKIKSAKAIPGNHIVLVGSHTGRDGIHGASFASKELNENSKEDRPSVQVGDPFMKKVLIEATLEILELKEVVSCQDCGAAGLLSSTSEMASMGECGVELFLDKVHLREKGMKPWEIMLSESQERMVFMVADEGLDKVLNIAKKYDIPAEIIGKTNTSAIYTLSWNGEQQASLPPEVLTKGPVYTLTENEPEYLMEYKNKKCTASISLEEGIKKLLTDPNFASKKWVYSQYDHTVGNRTSLKPGEGGSAGIWLEEEGGIVGLTIDSNARQVFLDPYNGAQNTVWESYRNLVSDGFEPLGVTDCMNYGNPEKDEVAFQFVNSINGISDACRAADIPVVSGNVSLYNESPELRVYPTPTIGMIGYTKSYDKIIKNTFSENETVYLIGKKIDNKSDVGGSLYQMAFYDFLGGSVDSVDPKLEVSLKKAIFALREYGLLAGCVDVSEGGMFGALFEGLKSGNVGFESTLDSSQINEKILFGEVQGQYIISVEDSDQVENMLTEKDIPFKKLGKCCGNSIKLGNLNLNLSELVDLYDKAIELEMKK